MLRPISTLPLPTTAQILLRENGFMFCEDVVSHRGVVPEARHILQRWNLHSNECWRALIRPPSSSNCLTLWQGEIHSPRIATWSREVDAMLGGGIKLASITELCGAPGSGKTQISLQLCVTVQIPEVLGGVDGEALYIDTSSNFTPQRVREMADACSKHCSLLWEISCRNQGQKQKEFSTDKIMNGIHVVSVHGITPLLAAVKVLPQVLVQHPKIKLIIIDSLAFSFHCGEYCDTINRTSFIYRIMSDLQQLCVQKQIAIVVTNHLTTRLIGITGSEVLPALGESMGHRVNQRLILGHLCDNTKVAISLKGNNQCSASAKLRITQAGVRDI